MAACPDWPAIQFGSRQQYVYALQCLLRFHGECLTIDGKFGSDTRAAVSNFQRYHSLATDGIAGAATLMQLIRTVKLNTSNDAVRAAQYLIRQFESTTIDGAFSPQFESTVRCFQDKMQLSVDGVIGKNTWQHLFGYTGYNRRVFVSNTSLTLAEMRVNAQYILDCLRRHGWTKNAVCGMLGNMEAESTINPGRWEGGKEIASSGFGLVQWTPSTKYIGWADEQHLPTESMNSQLERILYEVATNKQWIQTKSYMFSFYTFTQSLQSPSYLACVFLHNYERPSNAESQESIRGAMAEKWYRSLD